MNNNDTYRPQNRGCPYFPDLIENQKLRHELKRVYKQEEEMELHNKVLTIINFLLIAFIVGAAIFLTIYSGMGAEVIEAYFHLFVSFAALMVAFAFALLTVDVILRAIIRRRNERKKQKADKKEDGNA